MGLNLMLLELKILKRVFSKNKYILYGGVDKEYKN